MFADVFNYSFLSGNKFEAPQMALIKIIHKLLSSFVMSFVLAMMDGKMNKTQSCPQACTASWKQTNSPTNAEQCEEYSRRSMHRELGASEGDLT